MLKIAEISSCRYKIELEAKFSRFFGKIFIFNMVFDILNLYFKWVYMPKTPF